MSAAFDLTRFSPDLLVLAAEQMPTEERAALVWRMRPAIQQLLAGTGEVDVNAVTKEVILSLTPLISRIDATAISPKEAIGRVRGVTDEPLAAIGALDPAAADALRWSWEQMRRLFHAAAERAEAKSWPMFEATTEREIEDTLTSPMGAAWRASILSMVAVIAARSEETRPRSVELAWQAFEETCVVVDLVLDSDEAEVISGSGDAESSVRAAAWLREALDPDDMAELEAARMRDLR